MKAFKSYEIKLILGLAGILALGVMSQWAYCAEKQVEKIISLFDGGGYVNQSQVENIVAGGEMSILKDESLHRYYKTSFTAPSSQIKELRFGSHREDAKSREWTVGSLSAFFSDSKMEGCETYDSFVKNMGFAERMREPRASIRGASWTRPATLFKGPYVISISTTDVTSPCVSALTIVEEKNYPKPKR
ncbi:hypothetical protein [Xanthomonas fragariae]|uniref:hypothetical protein n=1 Tax=Xanthomonas fragariae TaxID=48664 RepID=UPI0022AAC34F|nr:hypothetical protein [Xanthomonas fragariae]WAT13847.1 hypothetical protein OZ429_11890 [Xanthomonas fragariae]